MHTSLVLSDLRQLPVNEVVLEDVGGADAVPGVVLEHLNYEIKQVAVIEHAVQVVLLEIPLDVIKKDLLYAVEGHQELLFLIVYVISIFLVFCA